jgi:hypothetical protein
MEDNQMTKKKLKIDEDLLRVSRDYVNAQLDIMARYGSKPELTDEDFERLVAECAQYPQKLRNMTRKKTESS